MKSRGPAARDLEPEAAEGAGYDARTRLLALETDVETLRGAVGAILRILEHRVEALERAALRPEAALPPEPTERIPLASASRRLGIPPSTLRRWAAHGRIPGALALPSGRRLRWTVPSTTVQDLERRGATERTPGAARSRE